MTNSPETFEIDGSTFEVYPLMGREALRLARRLASYMTGIIAIGANADDESQINTSDIQAGLERFFDNCSEKELEDFADRMFAKMTMDGTKLDKTWSTVFIGKSGLMFKALIESIKIQFKDFFSMLEGSDLLKNRTSTKKTILAD
jgi:hypothetical protein